MMKNDVSVFNLHKSCRFRSAIRGFTLLELMMAIFIVLLLISFLVPAIKNLKRKTNEISCRSHLRQIGNLFVLYENDNNGKLPGVWSYSYFFPKSHGLTAGWHGKLAMYLMGPEFIKEHPSIKDNEYSEPYMNGGKGYDELEIFICPSAADNYDPGFLADSRYPHRRRYYMDAHTPDYLNLGTVPTSYAGINGIFNHAYFWTKSQYENADLSNIGAVVGAGSNRVKYATKSKRQSDMKRPESTILLVEAVPDINKTEAVLKDSQGHVFPLDSGRHEMTKDMGKLGDYNLSFMHDDIEEWWMSDWVNYGRIPSKWKDAFYEAYPYEKYKASFVPNRNYYSIVSRIDPTSTVSESDPSVYFSKFKSSSWKGTNVGVAFTNPDQYFYEDIYQYMVGEMNVLRGDHHVDKVSDHYLGNEIYDFSTFQ